MPDTGGVLNAEIVAWLKRPGEQVEEEEALCLVAWGGQRAEITAPARGVLRMIAVGAGKTVAAGNSLALIDIGVRALGGPPSPVPPPRHDPPTPPEPTELRPPPTPRFPRAGVDVSPDRNIIV